MARVVGVAVLCAIAWAFVALVAIEAVRVL